MKLDSLKFDEMIPNIQLGVVSGCFRASTNSFSYDQSQLIDEDPGHFRIELGYLVRLDA